MIKYEDLEKVNGLLAKVPVKQKQYVMVNERVKGFRQICPNGSITTEIVSMADGVVTIKATVLDGDVVLATGYAQEKEESSFINKTSYIENCETSAVGRALGFVGIGVDGSMASAEEVANAIINQNKPDKISKKEADEIAVLVTNSEYGIKSVMMHYRVKSFEDLTKEQAKELREKLNG